MKRKIQEFMELEKNNLNEKLATYAEDSIGTRYLGANSADLKREEAMKTYRTPFMRDRDRIIHSTSFRRLSHKTQIYNTMNLSEKYRTRLSHTMEVLQIAKSIGLVLGLNIDLIEAISLGHDLGHTPFGHIGEKTLNGILNGIDLLDGRIFTMNLGFRHNYQSVRLVDKLEEEYEGYSGLNLTYYVRDGIFKHTEKLKDEYSYYSSEKVSYNEEFDYAKRFSASIEGQVVAIADEIAQITHDIEDAMLKGVIEKKQFFELNNKSVNDIFKIYASEAQYTEEMMPNVFSRILIGCLIKDVIAYVESVEETVSRKENSKGQKVLMDKYVNFTPEVIPKVSELKHCYINSVIEAEDVNRMDGKGKYIIRKLFKAYLTNPKQLSSKMMVKFFNNESSFLNRNLTKFREIYIDNAIERFKKTIDRESHAKNIYYCYTDPSKISNDFENYIQLLSVWPIEANDKEKQYYLKKNSDRIEKISHLIKTNGTFSRYISDHISLMSDIEATNEFQTLYGYK